MQCKIVLLRFYTSTLYMYMVLDINITQAFYLSPPVSIRICFIFMLALGGAQKQENGYIGPPSQIYSWNGGGQGLQWEGGCSPNTPLKTEATTPTQSGGVQVTTQVCVQVLLTVRQSVTNKCTVYLNHKLLMQVFIVLL